MGEVYRATVMGYGKLTSPIGSRATRTKLVLAHTGHKSHWRKFGRAVGNIALLTAIIGSLQIRG